MPMLLTCYYRSPDASQRRLAIRDRHIEYILRHKPLIALAGAISDDAGNATGMFIALKTESRSDADAFIAEEPYNRADLFSQICIDRLMQFIPHANARFLEEELERERARLGRTAMPSTESAPPGRTHADQ